MWGRKQKNDAPPVYPELSNRQEGAMYRLVKLSNFMDYSMFTVCGVGVGADTVVGFALPVVGDLLSYFVALYVIANIFVHFRPVFRKHWFRLFWNASVDVMIGLIPFVGDVFDAYWHSYAKNTNLVRKHYGLPLLDALNTENADETVDAPPAAEVEQTGEEKEEQEKEEHKVEGDAVAAGESQ